MALHKPPISEAERTAILARIHAAWASRPQRLEEMKRRQAEGKDAARIAAYILKNQFKVQRVVLFGSLLNHEKMHERSDIDLSVWGLPSNQLIKAGAAIDGATYTYNFGPIDLVPFEMAFPHIQEAILEHGVEL